jgi:TPR repeat protein
VKTRFQAFAFKWFNLYRLRLGALHIRGIALKRDYTKAFYNFNLAAHQAGLYNLNPV